MAQTHTPGQIAYAEDCRRAPTYPDGGQRRTWAQLSPAVRQAWEREPTPRQHANRRPTP